MKKEVRMDHFDNDDQYIAHLEQKVELLNERLKPWRFLIKKIEKVMEHGWGGVIVKVKRGQVRTRLYFDDDWEDVKIGLTDPD